MGLRLLVILLLVSASSMNSGFAKSCGDMTTYLKAHVEPTRVLPAAMKVYLPLVEADKMPAENVEYVKIFDKAWLADIAGRSNRNIVLTIAPENIGGVKGGPDSVQKIFVGDTPMIFRPILSEEENYLYFMLPDKVRRTLAAGSLKRLLGVKSVSDAEVATVTDHLGVTHVGALSPFVVKQKPTEKLKFSEIPEDQLHDLLVFEFIAGNRDNIMENFLLDTEDQIISIDHDLAFADHLPSYLPEMPIGGSLPKSYKSEFVQRLKSLTKEEVTDALRYDLMPDEIDFLWLRIQIVLEDIATMP